jgi:hypothetical protein
MRYSDIKHRIQLLRAHGWWRDKFVGGWSKQWDSPDGWCHHRRRIPNDMVLQMSHDNGNFDYLLRLHDMLGVREIREAMGNDGGADSM